MVTCQEAYLEIARGIFVTSVRSPTEEAERDNATVA